MESIDRAGCNSHLIHGELLGGEQLHNVLQGEERGDDVGQAVANQLGDLLHEALAAGEGVGCDEQRRADVRQLALVRNRARAPARSNGGR